MGLNRSINVPLLISWEQVADVATALAAVAALGTAIVAMFAARHSARSTRIAQQGVEDAQQSSYEERIHRYSSAIQQQGAEMVAGVSAFSAHLQAVVEDEPEHQERSRDPRSLLRQSLSHVWTAPGLLSVHVNPAQRLSREIEEAGDELNTTAQLTAVLARWNLRALEASQAEAKHLQEYILSDKATSASLKDFVTDYPAAAGQKTLQYAEYLLEKSRDVLVNKLTAMESALRTHAESWTPPNKQKGDAR